MEFSGLRGSPETHFSALAHAVFEEQEAAMRSAVDAEVRSRVQAELARVKADMETVMRVEQEKLMEASRQV